MIIFSHSNRRLWSTSRYLIFSIVIYCEKILAAPTANVSKKLNPNNPMDTNNAVLTTSVENFLFKIQKKF